MIGWMEAGGVGKILEWRGGGIGGRGSERGVVCPFGSWGWEWVKGGVDRKIIFYSDLQITFVLRALASALI